MSSKIHSSWSTKKSSVGTKCSLFDQQSLPITELAGLVRDFSSRATKKKKAKSLILPSVGYQRKENRWATPNNTGTTVLQNRPAVQQQKALTNTVSSSKCCRAHTSFTRPFKNIICHHVLQSFLCSLRNPLIYSVGRYRVLFYKAI